MAARSAGWGSGSRGAVFRSPAEIVFSVAMSVGLMILAVAVAWNRASVFSANSPASERFSLRHKTAGSISELSAENLGENWISRTEPESPEGGYWFRPSLQPGSEIRAIEADLIFSPGVFIEIGFERQGESGYVFRLSPAGLQVALTFPGGERFLIEKVPLAEQAERVALRIAAAPTETVVSISDRPVYRLKADRMGESGVYVRASNPVPSFERFRVLTAPETPGVEPADSVDNGVGMTGDVP